MHVGTLVILMLRRPQLFYFWMMSFNAACLWIMTIFTCDTPGSCVGSIVNCKIEDGQGLRIDRQSFEYNCPEVVLCGVQSLFYTRGNHPSISRTRKLRVIFESLTPVPDSFVSSAGNLLPYRTYPYPTKHSLKFSAPFLVLLP